MLPLHRVCTIVREIVGNKVGFLVLSDFVTHFDCILLPLFCLLNLLIVSIYLHITCNFDKAAETLSVQRFSLRSKTIILIAGTIINYCVCALVCV